MDSCHRRRAVVIAVVAIIIAVVVATSGGSSSHTPPRRPHHHTPNNGPHAQDHERYPSTQDDTDAHDHEDADAHHGSFLGDDVS